MTQADPSANQDDPSGRDLREAASLRAEEARRRSKTAAIRRNELAKALAGTDRGKHPPIERARRAANEALVRSAEAHDSSADAHEAAAELYERVAQMAEEHGDGDRASRYREAATRAREDAQLAVRLAQEDRDRVGHEPE